MAVPSPAPTDINPSQLSPKPSLRRRLFSTDTRKAAATQGKKTTQSTDSSLPAADHPIENSTSTSSKLIQDSQTSSSHVTPIQGTLTAGRPDEGLASTSHNASGSAQPPSVAAVPAPDARLRAQQDETDKEQASVSATLIANDRRLPFYRRKDGNTSYTSDAALDSPSDPSLVKPPQGASTQGRPPLRTGPSFFSRVLYKIVPCVGPDPRIIIGQDDHRLSLPPAHKATNGRVEMRNLQSGPLVPPLTISQPTIDLASLPLAITPITVSQPPSPTDSEIIVPPPLSTQLLPEDETNSVTSGAVQPPGSTGSSPGEIVRAHTHDTASTGDESDGTTYTDDEGEERQIAMDQDEEDRLIKNGGSGIPIGPDGVPKPLLPPILPRHAGRKCLVLDLDETLVHSSFKAVQQADFIVPVEIEYHWHHFHVLKRPGVDNFLKQMGELYEVVVFTASLSKYADPVLDKLDTHKVVAHRLFRESCFSHKGNYVKDLSQLGRPIADTIILDNSPASYIFHPNNAVPVSSWFNDPHDAELTDLIPFLADLTYVPDVRGILDGAR